MNGRWGSGAGSVGAGPGLGRPRGATFFRFGMRARFGARLGALARTRPATLRLAAAALRGVLLAAARRFAIGEGGFLAGRARLALGRAGGFFFAGALRATFAAYWLWT